MDVWAGGWRGWKTVVEDGAVLRMGTLQFLVSFWLEVVGPKGKAQMSGFLEIASDRILRSYLFKGR